MKLIGLQRVPATIAAPVTPYKGLPLGGHNQAFLIRMIPSN